MNPPPDTQNSNPINPHSKNNPGNPLWPAGTGGSTCSVNKKSQTGKQWVTDYERVEEFKVDIKTASILEIHPVTNRPPGSRKQVLPPDGYIHKPIKESVYLDKIKELLG